MLAVVSARTLIRRARQRAGLTQAQLAERVGTTQSAIARIETGATEPSLARVDLLVSACGGRLVIELDPDPASGSVAAGSVDYQSRWDAAVRAANFVLAGREAVARR
jgi:transcriptional regulator with XRE-family HTH domain